MRIDLISIFPEFFDVLDLSLIGRAQADRLLEIRRHNLRDYTEDKHRTVDSPPAGGGAGMVMKPEPWAKALETVLEDTASRPSPLAQSSSESSSELGSPLGSVTRALPVKPTLIIPTPSGEAFTQRHAEELAGAEHLVFAPGRFEGIDERVTEWAAEHFQLRRCSIGDYVLNGGEAAAVVMIEAITRLIPGVIGNEASLNEESHGETGLLEYPVYTKPAQWRGHQIPEVLLSGNHAKIAQWRREQAEARTRATRPDLWTRYTAD
ncbi:tRNA (guanosine(37)-N1)-methyltransferase TrmD [Nesterenkonia ebinurensis]|uniref:tRNA (guanosine(37)-N1)-methyltransferase TrmD n=1 Tax=Nesterenkonia ebinurensis TaxID=2608252 RepID=UPI00123D0B46|nr:tRNA (guanosine(37)-N1)-methyltransferase TrmD [Nesterenkonia ebinurensis]